MTDIPTVHVPSQSMFRDVYNLNSPHGPIIVWESLYPEDTESKYRYVVTLDGAFNRRVLDWFSVTGWFSDIANTKAECIAEADGLFKLSEATQNPQCKADPVRRNIRLSEWERSSKRYA